MVLREGEVCQFSVETPEEIPASKEKKKPAKKTVKKPTSRKKSN
jgi:hypothetical protein